MGGDLSPLLFLGCPFVQKTVGWEMLKMPVRPVRVPLRPSRRPVRSICQRRRFRFCMIADCGRGVSRACLGALCELRTCAGYCGVDGCRFGSRCGWALLLASCCCKAAGGCAGVNSLGGKHAKVLRESKSPGRGARPLIMLPNRGLWPSTRAAELMLRGPGEMLRSSANELLGQAVRVGEILP